MRREETEAGRRAAMKGSEGRNCGLWMLCRGVLAVACLATVLGAVAAAPVAKTTAIVIDGNPQDWATYPGLIRDAVGDNQGGGFDISEVRAFTNDAYLYLLIETNGARKDYVQVPIDVQAGARHLRLIIRPEEGGPAELAEISTEGEFTDLGSVENSVCCAATAVELKVPLAALDGVQDLTLLDVRPMAGEPGEPSWHAVDHAGPAEIPHLNEVESVSEVPRVCDVSVLPPSPVGSFQSAPVRFAQPGFRAEWFVPPGVFNMPQEALLAPSGDILVLSTRSQTLFRVTDDGHVSTLCTNVFGYQGAVDSQGSVYIHNAPDGRITRISPQGAATVIVDSSQVRSDCDSAFGIGPDGNMYLALSHCSDVATLLRITPSGAVSTVKEGINSLTAFSSSPDGRFLAAGQGKVYELSLRDFGLTLLGTVPGELDISPAGLTADQAGNTYVSTGGRKTHGEVYCLDREGRWTRTAYVPGNGLSGIKWVSSTAEIVGCQLRLGSLIAVSTDGSVRTVVAGNGLITPMGIAFSPCGDMAIACDDGGMMALASPAGSVSWFFDYISFSTSFVAFAADGTLYASEAAPGLEPVRVAMMRPGESLETYAAAAMPNGLACRPNGAVLVSESSLGRISEFRSDGTRVTLGDGLETPQALTLSADGTIYAVTGAKGNTITCVTAGGQVATFAHLGNWTRALAISPTGQLFATRDDGVVTISPNGAAQSFLTGLRLPAGLAFDFAGNLYVSDEVFNGVVRVSGFPHGTLRGVVVDEASRAISGARIQAVSSCPGVAGAVVTSSNEGGFSFQAAPCTCTLNVTEPGYQNATLEHVSVEAGKETTVTLVLKRA